jgi:hypothetical protein
MTETPGPSAGAGQIGSLAEARAVLIYGEGTLVGEGNWRRVRRIGDVVYKIDRTSSSMNEVEYKVAEAGRAKLPPQILIPPMTLHDVDGVDVLAMPYIDGVQVGICPEDDDLGPCDDCSTCLPTGVARQIEAVTPDGVIKGNTIRQGDVYVIIDLDYPPDTF